MRNKYLILFFVTSWLVAKEDESPINFTDYEIKPIWKIDCEAKRECLKKCGFGRTDFTYDYSAGSAKLNMSECTRKCNLIDCNLPNQEPRK